MLVDTVASNRPGGNNSTDSGLSNSKACESEQEGVSTCMSICCRQ